MKNLILLTISKLLFSFLFLTIIFLQNLLASYTSVGRYSVHTNSSLNSTLMLNITAGWETDCLMKCLNVPRCLSLNIIKETMETDGKMTCHLFNVTHNSLSLNLVPKHSVDHYKIELFEDCLEWKRWGSTTAVHKIQYRNGTQFEVYCDMETDGGGWTVIQKRFNGTVDFAKPWVDYKKGFGDVNGEFWLGLDAMHELTKRGNSTLRVDMWDNGDYAYAVYSNVKIRNETQGYRLDYEALIDGSAIASDSLRLSKGMKFSTYDLDNDMKLDGSCSNSRGNAGWWFGECSYANPNGVYTPGSLTYDRSERNIYWDSFRGLYYPIQKIELKLRRR